MTKRDYWVWCLLLHIPMLLAASRHESVSAQPSLPPTPATRWVNTSHLDHLYRTTRLANGTEVGTIGIYTNYPTYELITDADEGFTCVDDVARAVLFLAHEPDIATNTDKQAKLRNLIEFVLHLQSPAGSAGAGYFYNFLFPDLSINRMGPTSINKASWWSWRALWGLTEAYPFVKPIDLALAERIQTATNLVVANILRDFGNKPTEFSSVQGVNIPQWLPSGSGSDQAAIMMLGLLNYQQQTAADDRIDALLGHLGDGILAMQHGTVGQFPYGAFLSFENNWHAYGNDQSYALLRAGKALNKPAWLEAARLEIDHFYPYLLREGFLESFAIGQSGSEIVGLTKSSFAQIAYGIRPMIWSTLELYDQTKDPKYATQAAQLAGWYLGKNVARTMMYDRITGRCFDGIQDASKINKNSGAESTIEALWAFQRIDMYPAVLTQLNKYR